ncbi:MAG: hypothetical protein K2O06_09335 [Acetatifactor sp.]|nr:hypothetical protein [Acetatifactor sp.]
MTDSEKLNHILTEMQSMKTEMRDVKAEMQSMKAEMQDVKAEMQDMKAEMQDVKAEMCDMKDDIHEIKQKVTKTDLTLENEIRVNIQRVAEGHLDLSRNLHDAMRPSNEVEMLAIKVRMLETDVKELKTKLA